MEQFEKMMSLVVKPVGNTPVYNCMLLVEYEEKGMIFSKAIGTAREDGETISPGHRFRTGSITKLFTATIILQLAEEGLLKTDDLFFNLVNEKTRKALSGLHIPGNVDYSPMISVLHLLQHRTGLRDYFSDDEDFLEYVMQHPSQSWNWELVMEKYFEFDQNTKTTFIPGNGFHYSDTNYLLLGILIEQISGKPLHRVFREKIISPLGLDDTYLEFYEMPGEYIPIVYPFYAQHSLESVNTSFDWGGGGLISTMHDLNIFIRSLIKGVLFKKSETLQCMMQFRETGDGLPQYGLGIQKKPFPGHSLVGHNSAYGSMVFYEPGKDISVILSLNQAAAMHKAEWLLSKVVDNLK